MSAERDLIDECPQAAAGRTRTIVVVGAGFSGAATAINLLRIGGQTRLRVILVNKFGRMARGVAYGTRSAEHVLNVPAGNMSALTEDPEDFLRFCQWLDPAVTPTSFVSRRVYGTYLEALLAAAEHDSSDAAVLEREVQEVVAICVNSAGKRADVRLAEGRSIIANRVVLAFGHFAPANPPVSTPDFYGSKRYIRDPWEPGALRRIRTQDPVLLLGTGLTALDVALALQHGHRSAPIFCLSRRGLSPHPHRPSRAVASGLDVQALLADMGCDLRSYVKAVRCSVRGRRAAGEDWRDVLAELRPHTPLLWQRLSLQEKRRFLRHVQPHWDVLRHRCAPVSAARYEQLLAGGDVRIAAGRVLALREGPHDDRVTWRPRGGDAVARDCVSYVINCTGPDSAVRRTQSPLVQSLLDAGQISADPLGLGIAVDETYAVINNAGKASPVMSYVGPLLKARDWEATAVPELRGHAARLARHLLNSLRDDSCSSRADPAPARELGVAAAIPVG